MKSKGKNKRKKHKFLRFITVYVSVLAVAIVGSWWLLYDFIGDYEEGQPANVMDEIVEQLNANDVAGVLKNVRIEANEFENDTDRLTEYLSNAVKSGDVTYSKKGGEYSEKNPVYLLYSAGNPIAKVTLTASGENRFKFTLWRLGKIYVGSDLGSKNTDDVTITVPKGSKVSVNGVLLTNDYIAEDNIEFEPCKNVGEYVEQPLKTTYKVSGLMMQPSVTASLNGAALDLTCDDNVYTALYPSDAELLAGMENSIISLNHAYGEYIINKGSLSAVTSNMTGNAKEYMSDIPAVWAFLYGKEYVYEFQNEAISDFVKYSDECFSCHVYYDLYVTWNTGNVTYPTALTYTYVLSDGKWLVADFTIE